MPRTLLAATGAFCLVLAVATPARATCWIDRERPTTADQQPVTSPRVAAPRAAARAINAALKANPILRELPDARLRSTWQITGHPARTGESYGVHLVLWAHGKEAWAGECDLIPQADRLEPLAAIVVQTNSVTSTLGQRPSAVRDEQLQAFVEPEVVGHVGSYPVYQGQWVVLTFDGRLPWVPVTMAEYLAFEERRLVEAEAETSRDIARAQAGAGRLDDAALRKAYEAMKQTNPAEAEQFLKMMEDVRQQAARAAAAAPPVANPQTAALADLRALRRSLTAEQLQAQAREGYTSPTPRAPIERLPKLVKLDPTFPRDGADPGRIRLMEVHYSGRGEVYSGLMAQAAAALDWAALERLMK